MQHLKVGDIVVQGGRRYRVEMVGDPSHSYPEMRSSYGVPVDAAGRPTSMREVRLTQTDSVRHRVAAILGCTPASLAAHSDAELEAFERSEQAGRGGGR